MHPLIAYDLAKSRINDLHAEADRERLAATARAPRIRTDRDPVVPARWALHRLFAKLHLAGSGA
jgi:hypothetical protein